MIGCNRGLGLCKPHAMVWSDRQPYWQSLGHLRTYTGLRIISRTVFNSNVRCRKEPHAPEFDGTYLAIDITIDGVFRKPTFELNKPFVSGPTVVLVMLQLAVIAGYKRVGLLGVDFVYDNQEDTHFFGKGEDLGAFEMQGVDRKRMFQLLRIVGDAIVEKDVEVCNLSTVRGPVDGLFPPADLKEWLE